MLEIFADGFGFEIGVQLQSTHEYQVDDLFVVDLKVRTLDPEAVRVRRAPQEQVGEEAGEDPTRLGVEVAGEVLRIAEDGEALAGAGLPVGEDAAVIALSHD
jgi:hypothetical protein